ncbi:MAG: hypothetical protein ACREEB_18990 [Caulobacteraceae bacterium]
MRALSPRRATAAAPPAAETHDLDLARPDEAFEALRRVAYADAAGEKLVVLKTPDRVPPHQRHLVAPQEQVFSAYSTVPRLPPRTEPVTLIRQPIEPEPKVAAPRKRRAAKR